MCATNSQLWHPYVPYFGQRAEEWLRVSVALTQDWGLRPNTHMISSTAHMWYTYIYVGIDAYTLKQMNLIKRKKKGGKEKKKKTRPGDC